MLETWPFDGETLLPICIDAPETNAPIYAGSKSNDTNFFLIISCLPEDRIPVRPFHAMQAIPWGTKLGNFGSLGLGTFLLAGR